MGLDYSFCLYVPRAALRPLLAAVAVQAEPHGDEHTVVVFDDGSTLTMPFTSPSHATLFTSGQTITASPPRLQLNTVIRFPADEYLLAYQAEEAVHGSQVSIGIIYLTTWDRPNLLPGCVSVSFTAATTSMSRLFVASPSVRGFFIDLARHVGAHLCILDVEDDGFIALYAPQPNPILEQLERPRPTG